MIVVVFDIDGTLTPITSSWAYVHRVLNTWIRGRKYMELFFNGFISYDEWVVLDLSLWKDVPYYIFTKILYTIPWRSGIEELKKVIEQHSDVFFLAISGGFDILGLRAVKELGFNDYIGVSVEIDSNARITGFAKDYVDFNGKGIALREYLERKNLKPRYIISVGDSANDIELFKYSDISIAFCPKKDLENYSSIVIKSCNIRLLAQVLNHLLHKLKRI